MSEFDLRRIPLRKAVENVSITDWAKDEASNIPVKQASSGGDYRMPTDRTRGCEVFRRYMNGQLDLDYAKNVVIDCLHTYKDGVQLTDMEQLILSFCFPAVFNFVDPVIASKMKMLQFRLQDYELFQIQMAVADHLAAEMNYTMRPKP